MSTEKTTYGSLGQTDDWLEFHHPDDGRRIAILASHLWALSQGPTFDQTRQQHSTLIAGINNTKIEVRESIDEVIAIRDAAAQRRWEKAREALMRPQTLPDTGITLKYGEADA